MILEKIKKEDCISLLKEYKCPPWVIDHSQKVADKALIISQNFHVNLKLVSAGALLHDIGRSQSNGTDHAVIGARILKDLEFPPSIINIVERHIGAGIIIVEAEKIGLPPKNYFPVTIEEKIVSHSDNLLDGSKEVNIDFVVQKWEKRLGKNHPSLERLKILHRELIIAPGCFKYLP
ncbi:MAG: TIGR00295 family protein [Euryarchaeota archaeon]|nr:TIGR00295 family protein [Euryarchaeota archaeon]MBU4607905.1 TIGR00295 family protein [Euryarchaeota archaeon]MBV1754423.1 TIGR00295 family protein [Methanobacterium sp.]